jgi:hypothetical protein
VVCAAVLFAPLVSPPIPDERVAVTVNEPGASTCHHRVRRTVLTAPGARTSPASEVKVQGPAAFDPLKVQSVLIGGPDKMRGPGPVKTAAFTTKVIGPAVGAAPMLRIWMK